MTRATVTQLRAPRAATRLGPKEARVLVGRAKAAGLITSPTARALFEHLLRVCDPRQGFTQQIPQLDQDRMSGLTNELAVSTRTLRRANRVLEQSGLVRVESGIGRTWTRYTLNVEEITSVLGELPGSPWGTAPVHPGENLPAETGQSVPSEGPKRPLRPDELAGQRGQNPDPNARARVYAREEDLSKTNSPYPRDPASGPRVNDSPPASGQGPLSDSKCPHERTLAQGGCRKCKTTPRELAKREAAEQRAERDRARIADQLRQRDEVEAARAAAGPPDPEVVKAARAAARAGKRAPK